MAERNEYLTAEEVMEHLKLGRTFVYEQARLYLATKGAEGLPCRRFGRLLRFPLADIEAHGRPTGDARVVELDTRRRPHSPAPAKPAPAKPAPAEPGRRRTPRRRATGTEHQSTLPFTD
ncbi:MAG: helix-turn-helix domain-containing protein [Acidimicrobiia bacterium]